MHKWVSTTKKKNFLQWFLRHHQLKTIEARKIIDLLLNKPPLLENLGFTEEIKLGEKTIIISSYNSDEKGFQYYMRKEKTDHVAVAYNDLISEPSSKVNIIVNFYGKQWNTNYMQLLETSPLDKIKKYELLEKNEREIDTLLEKITLQKQINQALDSKDEAMFKILIEKYNRLG